MMRAKVASMSWPGPSKRIIREHRAPASSMSSSRRIPIITRRSRPSNPASPRRPDSSCRNGTSSLSPRGTSRAAPAAKFSYLRRSETRQRKRRAYARPPAETHDTTAPASFDPATAIAFEICRIARPHDIEIFYRPLIRGHLERWLRARKLHLCACVQAGDDLGRGCGAGFHHGSQVYHADELKHPHHAALGHVRFSFLVCSIRNTENNPRPDLGGRRARVRFARPRPFSPAVPAG